MSAAGGDPTGSTTGWPREQVRQVRQAQPEPQQESQARPVLLGLLARLDRLVLARQARLVLARQARQARPDQLDRLEPPRGLQARPVSQGLLAQLDRTDWSARTVLNGSLASSHRPLGRVRSATST